MNCERPLSKVTIEDPYWDQDTPIFFKTKDGQELPATFSFDTEIPDSEIYSRIYKDPELFAKLQAATVHSPIKISEALKKLHISEKQFITFGLRKGVLVSGDLVLPTDIFPKYLAPLIPAHHEELRQEVVKKWLGALPIEVGLDGAQVEIRHKSFETTPRGYKAIMETVQSKVGKPETHFHLGIPKHAISDAQFLAVARAIETRVILRLAIEDPEPTQKLSYSISYLDDIGIWNKLSDGTRGVIKAQLNAFKGEIPAHDIELREWTTSEQALSEIKFAIQLAQEPEKLRILPGPRELPIFDVYTQNLRGALQYTAAVLSFSNKEEVVALATKLKTIAYQMTDSEGPTAEERLLVAKILSENNILDLLDAEAFRK